MSTTTAAVVSTGTFDVAYVFTGCLGPAHNHIKILITCDKFSIQPLVLSGDKAGLSSRFCTGKSRARRQCFQVVCLFDSCERNISKMGNFFKFVTNIHLNSRMRWLDFDGRRSNVKIYMLWCRPILMNAIFQRTSWRNFIRPRTTSTWTRGQAD